MDAQGRIRDKVIIVTGASSGIGRATALELAKERPRLVLVARRRELLDQLKTEVNSLGTEAVVLVLDLTRRDDVETMVEAAHEQFERIDVLINNAGFGYYGTVEQTPQYVIREIFDLNFEAPLLATQLVIPIMRAQGGGHILNISSVAGKRGLPLTGLYCATKFALNGISEALRVELKPDNIDVSIINPAATHSEFGKHVRKGDGIADFKPIGYVQPAEEVAQAIVACIKRPRVEIYPYGASRLLAWMNAVTPSFVDWGIRKFLRARIPETAGLDRSVQNN